MFYNKELFANFDGEYVFCGYGLFNSNHKLISFHFTKEAAEAALEKALLEAGSSSNSPAP